MISFLKSAKEELDNLINMYEELSYDPVAPERHVITIKHQHKKTYYYKITTTGGKRKSIYIGDKDSPKLKQLARASYKKELMNVIKNNIDVLNTMLDGFMPYMKSDIVARISPCLSRVDFDVEFSNVSRELYEWANSDYEKNPREFGKSKIYAKDGTRVRSRVECLIYNALLDARIPFRYEPLVPFKRKNAYGEYETVYEAPDFLIKCPDGSYVIIEHAGMMSGTQYAANLTNKIQLYLLNGYCIGTTLFVTSDTIDGGMDSSMVDKVIEIIRSKFYYL